MLLLHLASDTKILHLNGLKPQLDTEHASSHTSHATEIPDEE